MGIDPIASQPSLGHWQEETKIRRTIELLGHTINTRQSRRAGETYILALTCVQIRVSGTSSL
jgi:hypothetical protein